MGWYKLIFKQNQPIHIGSSKWGVVKETDIFISGQTMWGALTNMYAHKHNIKPDDIKTYFEQISNFFPSFDEKNILKPSYKDGEFHLGDYSEEKFRFYFVDTIVQTAIVPINRNAKDESLHEFDFILQKPKQKLEDFKAENLHWIGIINIEETINNFLKNGLKIYVGADVRYGFGELELVSIQGLNEDKEFWWINDTAIEIKSDESSPYFIQIDNNIQKIEGENIIIPEMDFLENTPKVKDAKFYISVGSKIKISNGNLQNYRLNKGKLIKEN